MLNFIGSIFWVLLALAAIGQSTKESRNRSIDSLPDDHDVALYQNVLESQLRRMDGIDAILSATGLLIFTAMTYLFSLDGIKDGPLTARVICLALLIPLAGTIVAVVSFPGREAPDLEAFDKFLRTDDRKTTFEKTREVLVEAFLTNRRATRAKKMLRTWLTLLAGACFLADWLTFVVKW